MTKTAKQQRDPWRLKKTEFLCRPEKAGSVFLAGTFNGWDPNSTPMKRQRDGTWRAELEVVPGRHEYKFVVDGVWCCEPGRDDAASFEGCVPNPFGTMNRSIHVPGNPKADEAKAAEASHSS